MVCERKKKRERGRKNKREREKDSLERLCENFVGRQNLRPKFLPRRESNVDTLETKRLEGIFPKICKLRNYSSVN